MTALPEPVRWEAPLPGGWVRNFRLGEWLGAPMTPLLTEEKLSPLLAEDELRLAEETLETTS